MADFKVNILINDDCDWTADETESITLHVCETAEQGKQFVDDYIKNYNDDYNYDVRLLRHAEWEHTVKDIKAGKITVGTIERDMLAIDGCPYAFVVAKPFGK